MPGRRRSQDAVNGCPVAARFRAAAARFRAVPGVMRGGCQFGGERLDLGVQIPPAIEMRRNDAAKVAGKLA